MSDPEELISIDGEIVSVRDVFLNPLTNSALYGSGVFTTVAICSGQPVFWEKHFDRLVSNAAAIGIGLPAESLMLDSLTALISAKDIANARARVTVFDSSPSRLWSTEIGTRSRLLITADRRRDLPEVFRIADSPFPVNSGSPLAGIKSCNYLENLIALEEARKRGFDEAVRINERGETVAAACANLFWTRNGRVFTPGLETGCLAGTTRAFIIESFAVEEVSVGPDAIRDADAILLASAGIGARRAAFDNASTNPEAVADEVIKAVLDIYGM